MSTIPMQDEDVQTQASKSIPLQLPKAAHVDDILHRVQNVWSILAKEHEMR